ncbi:MAG: ABC transporter permease [Bacteroidales bacterium]
MGLSKFIQRYWHDIHIAMEAIIDNKVKSLLTALGIVFGVAAVISMLAIGNGAQQEILEQIKLVGVNNIIIEPKVSTTEDKSSTSSSSETTSEKVGFSRGLTLLDAQSIQTIIPSVEDVCPIISTSTTAISEGRSNKVNLAGTESNYFSMFNILIEKGENFSKLHSYSGMPVCIIGKNIETHFFSQIPAVGNYIKCGQEWLKIIGVIEKRTLTGSADGTMSISNTDNKIFIPIQTMLSRFTDRSLVRSDDVISNNTDSDVSATNYNQLDKLIVKVYDTEQLSETAKVIGKMLYRRHNEQNDYEISIPELLLKQEQRTKNIFNIVLGAIAGISLLVGGIGIMNIMLASVLERIREIGTRQAIGASRKDIVVQFLAESTLISLSGGILGIILGVLLARGISSFADIKTIITFSSILIAFGVSVVTGVMFGYLPAKQAAQKDPVESLRN